MILREDAAQYGYHVAGLVGDSLVYAGVWQLEVAAGPGGEDGAVGEDGVEAGGGQRPGLALALGVARGHHPHLGSSCVMSWSQASQCP